MFGINFDLSKIGTGQNITSNITPVVTTVSKIGTGQNITRAVVDVAAATKKVTTPAPSNPVVTPLFNSDDFFRTPAQPQPKPEPEPKKQPSGGMGEAEIIALLDDAFNKGKKEGAATQNWYSSPLGTGGGAVGTSDGYQVSGTDPADILAAGMANMQGQMGLGMNSFLSGWGDVGSGLGAGLGTGIGAAGTGVGSAWSAVGGGIGGSTQAVGDSIGKNIVPIVIIGGLVLLGTGLIARSAVP